MLKGLHINIDVKLHKLLKQAALDKGVSLQNIAVDLLMKIKEAKK